MSEDWKLEIHNRWKNEDQKRKKKRSKFSRDQRTRDARSHASNPTENNYFCLPTSF